MNPAERALPHRTDLMDGPQYKYIAGMVRRRIVRGEYTEGDKLPSEQALSAEFGVSRMTARQAIGLLVNEGLVRRVQGAGAYVASARVERDLNRITGFYEDFSEMGLDPGARVLSRERRLPTLDEQTRLGISRQRPVVSVTRVRTVAGVPFGLQVMTVPLHLVPEIESVDLETKSFYMYLRDELQMPLSHVDQHIAATIEPETSALIDIDPSIPFLRMERTSYVHVNTPIELLVSCFRADRYAYHVRLEGTPEVTE